MGAGCLNQDLRRGYGTSKDIQSSRSSEPIAMPLVSTSSTRAQNTKYPNSIPIALKHVVAKLLPSELLSHAIHIQRFSKELQEEGILTLAPLTLFINLFPHPQLPAFLHHRIHTSASSEHCLSIPSIQVFLSLTLLVLAFIFIAS